MQMTFYNVGVSRNIYTLRVSAETSSVSSWPRDPTHKLQSLDELSSRDEPTGLVCIPPNQPDLSLKPPHGFDRSQRRTRHQPRVGRRQWVPGSHDMPEHVTAVAWFPEFWPRRFAAPADHGCPSQAGDLQRLQRRSICSSAVRLLFCAKEPTTQSLGACSRTEQRR